MSLGMVDLSAQLAHKDLSGNIKDISTRPYPSTRVTSVGVDRVNVDDASNFAAGDTVLLIQMQGVGILTPNTGTYGNYDVSFGKPGAYEFLIVSSPPAGTEVVFKNNIISSYDPAGSVQLIRVPYFNSATVKSKLYCDPWNKLSGKGGVLAMILGRTLTLEADIDLSGLGFTGGRNGFPGTGLCQEDGTKTKDYFYDDSFRNAGLKGEGNSIHDKFKNPLIPAYARGMGPNSTGGGGGNGRFSGGGGGSNVGAGGKGGNEEFYCDLFGTPGDGGIGGLAPHPTLADRIFAGGGGGASTSLSGTGGEGGNGGGIIIIVTDTIISKGGKILVNGSAGANGSATGGAGGGGAGGSIALSLTNYGPLSNNLVLSGKGGRGGENLSSFGQGGGGGGGLIHVSKTIQPNVSIDSTGGTGAYNGLDGGKKEDFKAVLNGFLFNSIRSSVTGNDKDSICSDTRPPKITGTSPVGGTGPYTYKWEKSYDKSTWTDIGIATKDFTPSAPEANTVYYRRTITDSSIPTALVDVSKEVEIIVQPAIQGNTIGNDTTICYNQDPLPFISIASLTGGSSKNYYKYHWQDSITGGAYSDFSGNTVKNYDPPALTANRWYRRIVTSGRCVDTSLKASIIVLPLVSNNTITLPAVNEICNGMKFGDITGSKSPVLTGGDNIYRYKWEGNINNTGWTDTLGVVNLADYNPRERTGQNVYLFRRVVYSGPDDVCSSISNEVTLKDYAVITNNTISSPQTICAGLTPVALTGSSPANGDGTYSYTWQYRDKASLWAWSNTAVVNSSSAKDFSPPVLYDTIYYRRIVGSNACADTTLQLKITVHKALNNLISTLSGGSDTTICNGQDPFTLKGNVATGGTNIPGDYAYQWKSSSSLTGTYTAIDTATRTVYDPPVLFASTYYKRQVVSGACTLESSPVTITVLPAISGNNFNQDQTICYNTVPVQLAATVTGGDGTYIYKWEQSTDGTTWSVASGTSNSGSYTPPALTIPMKYRRTVTSGLSGCCSDVSNTVSISLHPALPTGKIVNTADTTIFASTPVLLNLNLTGSGPWKVTLSENSAAGTATQFAVSNPVISLIPETANGLSSFKYEISKVEDAFGCLATSIAGSKTVIIFNQDMFKFPEGFSPNHDAFNNTFEIKGLDLNNLEAEMSIVNSAGTEVFRTSNSAGQSWTSWDGTNSKGADLPEGTYYYLLKVRFPDSSVFRKSGFVILKRY